MTTATVHGDAVPGDGHERAGDRCVALPGGGELRVRRVEPADAGGLADLYGSLSDDDLYRRFFSVYRPDDRFFARMADVVGRGGYGVVAVESRPGEPERIVGEADYEPLTSGDGELAMAVRPGRRGWLGPYLLDALLEAAAARGVANIEASVLASNGRMLRVVHARGYATLADDDWCTQRALVSTSGRVPAWPGAHDRPRVLVEVPGGRWHAGPAAERQGLQVLCCPGPSGATTRCPLLDGARCPLVDGADAVVVSHHRQDERWAALLRAHRATGTGVPVLVQSYGESDVEDAGWGRLPTSGDEREVVAAVVRAVGARDRGTSAPDAADQRP
jgi:GNAT superfamily N-acetyltransferase